MKEISIIVISILLVIIGSNISLGYLTKTGDELIENIEELKGEVKKAKENEENKSEDLSNEIYEKWQKIQENWSIIVTHDELDLIDLSLIGIKTCIEEGEYQRCMEELEKSSFLLEHIQEKEKLNLKNVF